MISATQRNLSLMSRPERIKRLKEALKELPKINANPSLIVERRLQLEKLLIEEAKDKRRKKLWKKG